MSLSESILYQSLLASAKENNLINIIQRLEQIRPDLSNHYSNTEYEAKNCFQIKKLRHLHSFQVRLALKSIDLYQSLNSAKPLIVDIGDSSGSHYLYIKAYLDERKYDFDWISANLDPIAVEKTTKKGIPSLNCRAEEIHKEGLIPNICLSFEMLEHLFDPIRFLHDMSTKSSVNYYCITIPYLKQSRVGLHHIRKNQNQNKVYAENVHIFELSSSDWDLIFKFSGWKIVHSEIYLQYPKYGPMRITQPLWKYWDFEGFYGVILEKDHTHLDRYQDW